MKTTFFALPLKAPAEQGYNKKERERKAMSTMGWGRKL
jgi:hypothetical protein